MVSGMALCDEVRACDCDREVLRQRMPWWHHEINRQPRKPLDSPSAGNHGSGLDLLHHFGFAGGGTHRDDAQSSKPNGMLVNRAGSWSIDDPAGGADKTASGPSFQGHTVVFAGEDRYKRHRLNRCLPKKLPVAPSLELWILVLALPLEPWPEALEDFRTRSALETG